MLPNVALSFYYFRYKPWESKLRNIRDGITEIFLFFSGIVLYFLLYDKSNDEEYRVNFLIEINFKKTL
jgi:hypothetical protein